MMPALECHDVDSQKASRIRAASHAILARRRSRLQKTRNLAARLYGRVLEPALVATLGTVYLAWALERLHMIFG